MLKKIWMLVLLAVSCFGQSASTNTGVSAHDRNHTAGYLNGRGWLGMSKLKLSSAELGVGVQWGYLIGLIEGIAFTPEGVERLKNIEPKTLTYTETFTALTRFYEDPLNLDVPVFSALMIIRQRAEGVDPALVEQHLAAARAAAARAAAAQR